MKQLFYVPAVLVIEAQTAGDADARAELILDAMVALLPADFDGYSLANNSKASAASVNWHDYQQVLCGGDASSVVFVREELI